MRKMYIPVCIIIVLMIFFSGCKSENPGDEAVFRISKETCTLSEAKVFLASEQARYESALSRSDNIWNVDFDGTNMQDVIKEKVISQLSYIKCINLMANDKNVKLNKEEEKKAEDAGKEYYAALSDSDKEYVLIDEEGSIELFKQYLLALKVFDSITNNVETEVSDDDARIITLQQIYIGRDNSNAYDLIVKAQDEIKSGYDFNSVAGKYNEADAIEITVGRGELDEKLEAVVFSLKTGEKSDIIETDDGYYLFYCANHYNKELTDSNKEDILAKRKSKAFEDEYEPFVSELGSKFYDDVWDEVTINENKINASFYDIFSKYFK